MIRKIRIAYLVAIFVLVVATIYAIASPPVPVLVEAERVVPVTYRGHHTSYSLLAEYDDRSVVKLVVWLGFGWMVIIQASPLYVFYLRPRRPK